MKTYGRLYYQNGAWYLNHCPGHVAIRLKRVFQKLAAAARQPFRFLDTPETCLDLDWFTIRFPMQISPTDQQRLAAGCQTHRENQAVIARLFHADYQPRPIAFVDGLAPRRYQAQAVEMLARTRRLLVGDQVGLGKTVIAIGALALDELPKPALVVVQTHLQFQWREMIHQFLGSDIDVHLIKGTKPYNLPAAAVYIMKYSCLSGWMHSWDRQTAADGRNLQPRTDPGAPWFRFLVFDEIQELRRRQSQKYRAAQCFAEEAAFVLGLSATPVYNYGDEVFNIVDLIKPGALDSFDAFCREWANKQFHEKKILVKDPRALGEHLRDSLVFLRRTREDVALEMPPVNRIVESVDYNRRAVVEAEKLAAILSQKVLHGEFVESGRAARELDARLRCSTGIAKARHVAAYVRLIAEGGEAVLLAGWHRDVYEIWQEELADLNPVLYTGSESQRQKQRAKESFISGEAKVMMISLRSGIGLDGLQSVCRFVVFGEMDWSPAVHEQVIGRLYRHGQTNRVTAVYMVCNFGCDPVMVDVLGLKKSQAEAIIDPQKQGVAHQAADRSHIKLLAERYAAKKATADTI